MRVLFIIFLVFANFATSLFAQNKLSKIDTSDIPPRLKNGDGYIGGEAKVDSLIKAFRKIKNINGTSYVHIELYINESGHVVRYHIVNSTTKRSDCIADALQICRKLNDWNKPVLIYDKQLKRKRIIPAYHNVFIRY